MFVYAIHRETVWSTDYNALVFSSKKMAQKVVEGANVKYEKWKADKNAGLISCPYENPQPSRYRLEEIKVETNEIYD